MTWTNILAVNITAAAILNASGGIPSMRVTRKIDPATLVKLCARMMHIGPMFIESDGGR